MQIDDHSRCFGNHSKLYAHYHDTEWGVPVHEDQMLFEMLILEGAHAGLSWETVLKKRDGYRAQFHHFDVQRVANMTDVDLEDALQNSNIIRHRQKVFSTRKTRKYSNKFKPSTAVSTPIFGLMLMENLSSTTSRRLTTSQPRPPSATR